MRALIIGSGHRVDKELELVDRTSFDLVVGVNRAALLYGPVDVHVTLHPNIYAKEKAGWLVSHTPWNGVDEVVDYRWRKGGNSGSSGLFAVKYMLQRGATDVVLAGIGMDGAHSYTRSEWPQARYFRQTWVEVAPLLRGKVTSLGGWTAEILNGE